MTLFVCFVFEATYIKFEYVSLKFKRVPFLEKGLEFREALALYSANQLFHFYLMTQQIQWYLKSQGK